MCDSGNRQDFLTMNSSKWLRKLLVIKFSNAMKTVCLPGFNKTCYNESKLSRSVLI